ncbi:MAG: TolC family protein [Anaeromyxobacteraceae bacterium]
MVILTTLAALAISAAPAPLEELPLADALTELERANPGLAQARARADEADAVVRQAWSPLLPNLSAQGTWLKNSDDAALQLPALIAPPAGREVVLQPDHSLTVQGQARLALLAPSAWFDVAAAGGAARASGASAEAARRNARAAFTQAAHAARAAEELVLASEAAVKNAADLEGIASRKVAAGTAAPLDRLRAETERVKRESDLAQARANLGRARLALGVLLGRRAPVRVAVPEPAAAAAGPGAANLAAAALAARPELRASRAQVEAAQNQVRSAWARVAPTVSASGAIFASDTAYPTGEKNGWRATVDLTWALYDGGLRYGKRDEARARLASARAGEEAQRLAVVQEVEDAARDVDVAAERLRLAEAQRRLTGDAAGTAKRGFEAGVASSLDVIDANDRLYLADVGLADARARLAQARVALDRATGR